MITILRLAILLDVVAVLAVALKLTGVVSWPWIVVLWPFWLPCAMFGILLILVWSVSFVAAFLK